MDLRNATLVLVHGAGHTGNVWQQTRAAMRHRSTAVNLPARAGKPGDITTVMVGDAARSVAFDVRTHVDGDIVLVGHSAGAIVLPSIAAQLGSRVRMLVFVAGLCARQGELPAEVFQPGGSQRLAQHLVELRAQHRGRKLEELDVNVASTIDSLVYSCQPMEWAGLPDTVPRAFVRCLRDRKQPRDVQARLVACCGAREVVDIDTGHTPALEAPELLAATLDDLVDHS
jgi:pimeloyl-ACP methyl ester carboxylesterase